MDENQLFERAYKKKEWVEVLSGNMPYEITVSDFEVDVFPTAIPSVLRRYFYNRVDNCPNIGAIFQQTLEVMLDRDACSAYIALLYFEECLYAEKYRTSTFSIDRDKLTLKINKAIKKFGKQLEGTIVFPNGIKKPNPLHTIYHNIGPGIKSQFGIDILV